MFQDLLFELYRAALAAVDPRQAVRKSLRRSGAAIDCGGLRYDLDLFDRVLVVGAGKAAARMTLAVEELLGDRITGGLIIVKYGYTTPLRIVRQVEAAHPIPDQAGVKATSEIRELVRQADGRTLVLCLLSGGGSSLLVAPADGLSLAAKQRTTELLLKAGADIGELNAVRKHLSAVKGGRLARIASPATVATLIISDVIGGRLDVISSGPTAPDGTTFADALAVIKKYHLQADMPPEALSHLERGAAGLEEETAKRDDPCFARTRNSVVADLDQAIDAAREKAVSLGMRAGIATRELRGEARAAARFLADAAGTAQAGLKNGERVCLLSGGETTVTVQGSGKGGRNQELALAFALEIEGRPGITLLSAGTDGTDGPTDAAGAIVDGNTVRVAARHGLSAGDYLVNNDSYGFFRKLEALTSEGVHLKTGPTGTNVMDVQIMVVEKDARGGRGQGRNQL